jgi:drug/metabolite transporter (DMT)-like permease
MKRENLIVILFSVLSLLAFAANSILNRAGVADGAIGPASFAAVRVASAFVVLAAVFWIKERRLPAKPVHWLGPVGLLIYILGFSFGYLNLNAGFGALLLFGAVQIAMFVASWLRGHTPTVIEIGGAGIAFGGLVYLLAPNLGGGALLPSLFMAAAGVGWAMFSVSGQNARSALGATTSTFAVILLPVVAVYLFNTHEPITSYGVVLAMISGGITSALGYLVWYSVLPLLATTTAGVMQLTVPVIAIVAGIFLLGEPSDTRVWIASAAVICGVLISMFARKSAK